MIPSPLADLDRFRWRLTAVIVLVGGLTPLAIYGGLFASVPTVTPQVARQMLDDRNTSLVDVRPAGDFSDGHIDGAVNWPLDRIPRQASADAIPQELRGKRLLLICDVGLASRLAVGRLGGIESRSVFNVRGGIQEWVHSVQEMRRSPYHRWRVEHNAAIGFPFRDSPQWEQALATLAYFGFKPLYTFVAGTLIVLLWRSTAIDLVALRWAMWFFFLGENACAVNYFCFREESYLAEFAHSLGMMLCFGFAVSALIEAVDRRLLNLSDPQRRCAAISLCSRCIKQDHPVCGLKQVFYLLIAAAAVLAFMIPASGWNDIAYNTYVFGRFYNYGHLRVFQLLENVYCPAAAILLYGLAFLALARGTMHGWTASKVLFSAACGALSFGGLRALLGAAYDENRVWFLFWEETTELLFIAAVGWLLWVFRNSLFAESPHD